MVEVMLTLFAILVVGYIAARLGYMGGALTLRVPHLFCHQR